VFTIDEICSGLLLARALDVLRDHPHLLGALHDLVAAARLLRGGGCDLLHRLGDSSDRVRDLLRTLGLFHRGSRDRAAHRRGLLRALEDLLECALGLVRDLHAA
jgi:hypothetical protein